MGSGYTKSWRHKWDHPVFRNKLEAGIWSYLCDMAAWRDCTVRCGRHTFDIQRGQIVVSMHQLARDFCIDRQVIRTFFSNLQANLMVTLESTHQGTIITICNYDKYQQSESEANPQPTHG